MNKNICTWIYCDEYGEENIYPQVYGKSSSFKFQKVYWKCLITFFATSIKNNPNYNHILFTNLDKSKIPNIDNFNTINFLNTYKIKIITIPFTNRIKRKNYNHWGNQFYIFDILSYISKHDSRNNSYIILDSDCVWIHGADEIFQDIDKYSLLTYEDYVPENYPINGLNRLEMKEVFEELSKTKLLKTPKYFGGEWFGANVNAIKKVIKEFYKLKSIIIKRFEENKKSFYEEAQTLSYIYYKLGFAENTANQYIRRIWSYLFHFNNVNGQELSLVVWHVLSEKKFGIKRLFKKIISDDSIFWKIPKGNNFINLISKYMGIPKKNFAKLVMDIIDTLIYYIQKSIFK